MNFVLIISIIIMCYITSKYNTVDRFKNFLINLLVQIFHIATLVFILFISIKHGSFIVWIFCFFGANTIINNVLKLISDIINTFLYIMKKILNLKTLVKTKKLKLKLTMTRKIGNTVLLFYMIDLYFYCNINVI